MAYSETLDNLPDVVTGQLISASYISSLANAINAIEVALSTNPFGLYASVAAAIAGKLDINYGVDSQSSDNYAITLSPAPPSYTPGLLIRFNAHTTNAGPATLDVNALGPVPIKKLGNVDLAAGDILAGQVVELAYDGTSFQILSAPSGPMTALGDLAYGGVAGVPSRLSGNTSASRKFLTQTGTGYVSSAPDWSGILPADLPPLDQVPAPAANVSLNSKRIISLANPVNPTDAANAQTVQKGAMNYAADSGSANAYAVTLLPAPATYTAGLAVVFKAANANTGASTINVNSLGAAAIKKQQGQDLASGDILAGQVVSVAYDGSNFQLLSPPSTLDNPMSAVGDMIYGGIAGAESRLPGNTSATKQFLTQTGTGSASAEPAWGTIQPGDLPTLDQMPAPVASVSMNHERITYLADPTSLTDAVTAEIAQKGAMNYAADSGTANVYAVSLSPAPAAYTAGMTVGFKAANANTGASTLNVNSLGAIPIKKHDNEDLVSGDIQAGQIVSAVYDGTHFQMLSALPPLNQVPAPVASVSMNNERITNLADPTGLTDAATAEIVQKSAMIYAADSGSTNTYVVTLSPAPTAYAAGMIVVFKAANTNTGPSTLNVNGLGAVALVNSPYGSLTPSAIAAGQIVVALYDGAHFQVQSPWLNFDAFIHLAQFFT